MGRVEAAVRGADGPRAPTRRRRRRPLARQTARSAPVCTDTIAAQSIERNRLSVPFCATLCAKMSGQDVVLKVRATRWQCGSSGDSGKPVPYPSLLFRCLVRRSSSWATRRRARRASSSARSRTASARCGGGVGRRRFRARARAFASLLRIPRAALPRPLGTPSCARCARSPPRASAGAQADDWRGLSLPQI